MKVRDVLKRLFDDGWYQHRVRGSHRVLKHPTKDRNRGGSGADG